MHVRPLTDEERRILQVVPDQPDFAHRRAAIVLASAAGGRPAAIAAQLGVTSQTVRSAIHAFNQEGLAALDGGREGRTVGPLQRGWFTVEEAATELRIKPSTVRNAMFRGTLTAAVVAPRVRAITREEIERYRCEHQGIDQDGRRKDPGDPTNAAYQRAWRARKKAEAGS